MKRDFNAWLKTFKDELNNGYDYYINFNKVFENAKKFKIELNILNTLIGDKNIDADFVSLYKQYPAILKCIPELLAVRAFEIYAQDADGKFVYNFKNPNYSIEQYKIFMRKTGLFELLENHLIANLYDYVLGVEAGMDTNGRKNRSGHLIMV